ncbi:hypothetical protein LCGC14_2205150 [marine sediment metagenome]|uniref:Uncharacterized protein n=1 Tax=marine sediment metagenome TaxID=412755 RepID=A0A0F9FSV9_9ZZZZ
MSKTNTDSTYRLDLDNITVIHIAGDGEEHDLNSAGAQCTTLAELREFVSELHEQGAFDVTTRDELMSEVSS